MQYIDKLKYFHYEILKLYTESSSYFKQLEEYINNSNISSDELLMIKNSLPIFSQEHKKLLTIIDNKIFKQCNHKWTLDTSNTGERSQFICNTCKLYM